jgi:hypothetical protein
MQVPIGWLQVSLLFTADACAWSAMEHAFRHEQFLVYAKSPIHSPTRITTRKSASRLESHDLSSGEDRRRNRRLSLSID